MLLVIAGLILTSSPAFASPTLETTQSWNFSNATWDSTNQVWVSEASGNFNPNTGIEYANPTALIKAGESSYDQTTGTFTDVDYVKLYIPNYKNLNPTKLIEIQVSCTPYDVICDVLIEGDQALNYYQTYEELQQRHITLEYTVHPNPSWEWITLDFDDALDSNSLSDIYVYTQCIPAPGALFLAGIGASLVTWMRKRKTI